MKEMQKKLRNPGVGFRHTEVKDLCGQSHVLVQALFTPPTYKKGQHTFSPHVFLPSLGGQFNHFWLKKGASLPVLMLDPSSLTSRTRTVYSLHSQTAGVRNSDFCNVGLSTDSNVNVKLIRK